MGTRRSESRTLGRHDDRRCRRRRSVRLVPGGPAESDGTPPVQGRSRNRRHLGAQPRRRHPFGRARSSGSSAGHHIDPRHPSPPVGDGRHRGRRSRRSPSSTRSRGSNTPTTGLSRSRPTTASRSTRCCCCLRTSTRSKRYPVVVYTYGGPNAQVVVNEWPRTSGLFNHILTGRGFVVFALDNRGSAARGREFEGAMDLALGSKQLPDQLAGVRWLKSQPWVDPERDRNLGLVLRRLHDGLSP